MNSVISSRLTEYGDLLKPAASALSSSQFTNVPSDVIRRADAVSSNLYSARDSA